MRLRSLIYSTSQCSTANGKGKVGLYFKNPEDIFSEYEIPDSFHVDGLRSVHAFRVSKHTGKRLHA
jgi:hypothetical protein